MLNCEIWVITNFDTRPTSLTDDYKNKIIDMQKDRATAYFKKQIEQCKSIHLYDKINFHIILFPIADKEKIVDTFILKAKAHRA